MVDIDGTLIDEMIAEGRKIVEEAVAAFKPVAIVAAFSGGNDSVVSTHFAVSQYQAHVLHCNTNIGLKKTTEHMRNTCNRFGWDLIEEIARPEGKPKPLDASALPSGKWTDGKTAYEEYVFNFGFPGPGMHPRMYQRLKERSIQRHIKKLKVNKPRSAKILMISGIRHDESAIRAGYKRAFAQVPGRSQVWVNPFYWRTAADFEIYRQEFGLPRNPCKDRVGISGECLCGAFGDAASERIAIREIEPETADYLSQLEAACHSLGFPWNWGKRAPKWWRDALRGQMFMFEQCEPQFMPMCVGCSRRGTTNRPPSQGPS